MPVLVVNRNSTTYQPRTTDYILNWGCANPWEFITNTKFSGNKLAVNKLETFKQFAWWNEQFPTETVNIPEWTTSPQDALTWGKTFLARYTLTGHSGEGIQIIEPDDHNTYPIAPLYVQYKKKKHEYRVHVFNGQVIDVTQKKKRKDVEIIDTKIRNHKNGWVYARENINITDELCRQATLAIQALGLKFGAVDIIWNAFEDKYYVLEVNTAPGLEGKTLEAYTQAIIEELSNV